ncbi:MAG: DMT family transporter [Bacteroidales bacterium]|nr:DMT family transporter [Bacteroidales bacterium]
MNHIGEIISLIVAVSWTFSAWYADKASRRIGSMETNVIRLVLATIFLSALLWITIGHPYPVFANGKAWLWLGLSALVGYVFGDYCLFNSYLCIGPRLGQLMMTIAPPMAAVAGWLMLGESMSWKSILAMAVTLCGIGISILSRGEKHQLKLDIPIKGILLGIGAGTGQGVGLVLSKIGMEHYAAGVPADASAAMQSMLPFASTLIRAIVGAIGFFILLSLGGGIKSLGKAVKDPQGMKYATLLTIFGPALGVSLSLMAVRYANAGIASTLMALAPVLIIAPDVLVNKHKIKLKEIIGVLVSISGVAMFFLL